MREITLTFKGKDIQVYPVDGPMTIGSDPSCTITIDSLAVAKQHAKIELVGDDVVITDLSVDQGLFIGETLVQNHILKDGDAVNIGKHSLVYSAPTGTSSGNELAASLSEEKPRSAWLQILNGNNLGKTINLTRQITNLGKSGVQTAIIAHREDGYYLSHLEGENFPMVNDDPIGETSTRLDHGDTIQIGNIKLLFSYV